MILVNIAPKRCHQAPLPVHGGVLDRLILGVGCFGETILKRRVRVLVENRCKEGGAKLLEGLGVKLRLTVGATLLAATIT